MADKLKKIGADLERARAKREEWDRKVRELCQQMFPEETLADPLLVDSHQRMCPCGMHLMRAFTR